MTTTKVQGIEAIRGALAMTVFLCHGWIIFVGSGSTTGVGALHSTLNVVSRFAVVFFFVVSGFVIAMTIDRNRQRGFRAADYWVSRVARIAPPMLATIGITFALYLVLLYSETYYVSWGNAERGAYYTDPFTQLLALVTVTLAGDLQGGGFNGPLWSLTFEIQLYVVAGLLAVLAFGRWKLLALLALAAYLWAVAATSIEVGKPRQLGMAACFAAGAAAYMLRRTRTRVVIVLIAASLAALAPQLPWRNAHRLLDTPGWLLFQVLAACLFAEAVVAVSRTHRLDRWSWLGASSFTLYILHFPMLLAIYFVAFNVKRELVFGWPGYATAMLAVSIVFCVSVRVARAVERPAACRTWLLALWARVRSPAPSAA